MLNYRNSVVKIQVSKAFSALVDTLNLLGVTDIAVVRVKTAIIDTVWRTPTRPPIEKNVAFPTVAKTIIEIISITIVV